MKTHRLLIYSLLVLLYCCTPAPIDIDVKEHRPKLAVSAQIVPQQTMFISLTKSFSLLNNSSGISQAFLDKILIKNALVTISYFDKTDTLNMVAPGVYSSVNTLQYEYGSYTLYAHDPNTGESVSATTTILPQVVFDSIQPKVTFSGNDTLVTVKIRIKDIPGVDNWYVVNYYVNAPGVTTTSPDIYNYFNRGSNQLSELRLISDKEFENGYFTEERTLKHVKSDDTVAVTLSNISEGYYKFLSAYLKSGNIVNQITGEPINYPTNINGGYGYFNAHYPDVRIFELQKY